MDTVHFNKDTIDSLNRFAKNYRINITYFYGYLVKFDKANIYAINPHKILLRNSLKNLLIMHYADYIQNNDLYFIDGEKEPLTISKLRDYVKANF